MINYRTQDMFLAIFLRYQGFDISGIEGSGNQCTFIFDKPEEEIKSSKLLIDYFNRKTLVEPFRWKEYMSEIKSLIRNV